MRDIFKLQDEIVQSLIPTIGLQLSMLEKGIGVPQRTNNLEAYDYLLRGLEGMVTPSRPGEFHPEPLTEPDVSLSTYPARATHRRLPPSAETKRVHPAEQLTHDGSRRG